MSDRAAAIKANAFVEIGCPSGNYYLLKKGGPLDAATVYGHFQLDESLLPDEVKRIEDALNLPPELQIVAAKKNLAILEKFCRDWIVDPKIIFEGEPGEDEVSASQAGADIYHLMTMWIRYCNGALTDEDKAFFRRGLGSGEPGRAGTEIRSEAEPTGKDRG